MVAEIAILRKTQKIDRLFTYAVPKAYQNAIAVGTRVMVPFGKSVLIEGVVINLFLEVPKDSDYELKPVHFLFPDQVALHEKDIELVKFIRESYLCTYEEAIQLFLPTGTITKHVKQYRVKKIPTEGLKKTEKEILKGLDESFSKVDFSQYPFSQQVIRNALKRMEAMGVIESEDFYETDIKDKYENWIVPKVDMLDVLESIPQSYHAQIKLAQYLLENGSSEWNALRKKTKITKSVLDAFEKKTWISVEKRTSSKSLSLLSLVETTRKSSMPNLNDDQLKVVAEVKADKGHSSPYLLHGVTGSGKTEVYMTLIDEVLQKGKQVIFMVPEIALTPQMISRFVSQFGQEDIAVVHSKISPADRYDQWKKIKEGRYRIIIGVRSAVFSPCPNLGLMILDEAHESSYRSEKRPKYHTSEVAILRAKQHDAKIILGTATPTIVDFYKAQKNIYKLLSLKQRYNKKKVPSIQIVDMRQELIQGNRSILSEKLKEAIEVRLAKKEQTIIFLNRKGHSTFISCRSCGFTLDCPRCDVTLTYFKGAKKVKCHYCDYQSFIPKSCPKCESEYFKFFGLGTEKLEEQLKEIFPHARIRRMDRESTSKKGQTEAIIRSVEMEETDILVGTQMVSKGLDFNKVSLVGILSADILLNFPTYQSAERSFQLFNQVAGRAGRAHLTGEVILQTYNPDHYVLKHSAFETFYDEEIKQREMMNYPPFCKVVNLIFSSEKEELAEKTAKRSELFLKKSLFKKGLQNRIEMYEAHEALLKKIDGQYRWQILLKVSPENQLEIRSLIKTLCKHVQSIEKCQISVDLDAVHVF